MIMHMKRSHLLTIVVTAAWVAISPHPAPGASYQQLDPRALDDPFYRWNASVIRPKGTPPAPRPDNDYAEVVLGDPWDFEEGDTEGIKNTSEGVQELSVQDGKLCFVTGRYPWFYWGSYRTEDAFEDENIGANWSREARRNNPWQVRIRLKQSLPETTWKVIALNTSVRPTLKTTAKVEGTDWQDVIFTLQPNTHRIYALAVEPGDKPQNRVEIDDIRVVCPERFSYARQTVFLPAPTSSATLCLLPALDFVLYVNGKQVTTGLCSSTRRRWFTVDLTDFLHPGKNVIAYRERLGRNHRGPLAGMVIEGIVTLKTGDVRRFATDASWRAGYAYEPGWRDAEFDDTHWEAPEVVDKVINTRMPARGRLGMGRFVDPPYLGPIGISSPTHNPHVHRQEEGIRLDVRLPATGTFDNPYRLSWKLVRTFGGLGDFQRTSIDRGSLTDFRRDGSALVYPFRATPRPGVYDVVLTLERDDVMLDRRFFETAVVGRFDMPAATLADMPDALSLKLVDNIRCGDAEDPHPFLDGAHNGGVHTSPPSPETGTSRLGRVDDVPVRFVGHRKYDWFSYRFSVQQPFKPHFIDVRYVDRGQSSFEAKVTELHRKQYVNIGPLYANRNNAAVAYGGPFFPNTDGICTLRYVFFPRYENATVDIVNLNKKPDAPTAAIVDINIYEARALPALHIPEGSERLLADYAETFFIVLKNFYAGPDNDAFACSYGTAGHPHHGYYRNWYSTFDNLIRYKRFCGNNLVAYCFWYVWNPYFRSSKAPLRGPVDDGYLDLFFDMAEANDIRIMPCFELGGVSAAPQYGVEASSTTASDVRNGVYTRCRVSRDGRPLTYLGSINPVVPENRRFVSDLLGDIVKRYGDHPAFAGVANTLLWAVGPVWGTSIDEATASYDDYTIARFEAETGIEIPVDHDDPERFSKRWTWLRAEAWKAWTAFYARMQAECNREIADRLADIDPDVRYVAYYNAYPWIPLSETCMQGRPTLLEYLRTVAIDPELYKQQEHLTPGYTFISEHFIGRHTMTTGTRLGAMDETNLSDELHRLFDNGDNTLVFARQGFYETLLKAPKDWFWGEGTDGNPVIFPGSRYGTRNLTARLLKMTPGMLLYGWQDIALSQHSSGVIQTFATAFRSIPMGTYDTLSGHGLDRNIVVRRERNGAFYVVNPYWWQVTVELALSGQSLVKDLISGTSEDTERLSFTLGPYEVKVFNVPPGIRPTSASAGASAEGKRHVADAISLLGHLDSMVTTDELRLLNLYLSSTYEAKALIAEARTYLDNGDVLRAARLTDGFKLLNLRAFIVEKLALGDRGEPQARYRVNCGSAEAYTDEDGKTWLPDQAFENGLYSYGYLDGYSVDRGHQKQLEIENCPIEKVFHYERAGVKDGYAFKVPPGTYRVTLHFAITWQDAAYWDKHFTTETRFKMPAILANGEQVLPGGLDLYGETGWGTPYTTNFACTAVDGRITVGFAANAMVNGIEIQPVAP